MPWEINVTDEFEAWYMGLTHIGQQLIVPSIDALEEDGPTLGRPLVDTIKGSRHHNMKELRSVGQHMRVLFAFDPNRQAILLVGGDKRDRWKQWYAESVPIADELFDRYLKDIQP
ncbi:MAG TPA: type II toxin-antitoxin system RelE/ParE family toxin [Solirubrobacteraceae bacterium]|jgi:hypothetical protein